MSSVLESESYIDDSSALFMQRMGEYADSEAVVDLGEWLQMYAFDIVGELLFGRRFGCRYTVQFVMILIFQSCVFVFMLSGVVSFYGRCQSWFSIPLSLPILEL